jgi:asparagine synthetase B (glutamine-hydrolysing)
MCGIFCYSGIKYNEQELLKYANNISHRGPDSNNIKEINNIFLVFYRLAINGLNNGK